nr:SAM-dependent methyltransferase [Chloroflexia bacterium]
LYDPDHGYYLAPARRPGRGGDFLTAPEVHPFFGFTLARLVRACWERLGQPHPFTVREIGAGVGGLAYDIIAALSDEAPELRAALDYRLVELNPHRRAQAAAALAERGLGEVARVETPGADGQLPPIVGLTLANEVADALPVHRLVWRDGALRERWVTWDAAGARFADIERPLSPLVAALDLPAYLAGERVALAEDDVIEVSPAAAAWMTGVARGLSRGYALIVDYGYPATELYRAHRLTGTVRGYAGHTVTDDPYRCVGEQDLTAHVDFTRLRRAGEAAGLTFGGLTTQADFLAAAGLGDWLVRMQAEPGTTVADYYAAQSAVFRLIDPGGMGRFRVLAMAKDAPLTPPLPGLGPLAGRL